MNNKKILSLFLMSFIVLSLGAGLVSAQTKYQLEIVDGKLISTQIGGNTEKPIESVNTNTFPGNILEFFGFQGNLTLIVVQLIVVMILIAALFDILRLTMFTKTPRLLISIGIALITSMTGGIISLAAIAFSIAGGIAAFGVALIVIMAVVVFIILHFVSNKFFIHMLRQKSAAEAEQAREKIKTFAASVKEFAETMSGKGTTSGKSNE
jgi:hypothetical protein